MTIPTEWWTIEAGGDRWRVNEAAAKGIKSNLSVVKLSPTITFVDLTGAEVTLVTAHIVGLWHMTPEITRAHVKLEAVIDSLYNPKWETE